jgi:sulfate adenylyltransferase
MSEITLTRDQYLEFEKIGLGAFAPLQGFMNEDDFRSVVERMRLDDGAPFTLPVVLDVTAEAARCLRGASRIALVYGGIEVGEISPESFYSCDKEAEARAIFGTSEKAHPGAASFMGMGETFIGGPVKLAQRAELDISADELTPAQTKAIFAERGFETVVGFQTRNVPHRAHEYLQRVALELFSGLFVQPLVGRKKNGDYNPAAIMAAYRRLISEFYPKNRVVLGILSTAMRYAGPREAVFHAIIRRNYGCTHFIIGRDHAGVGDYYGTYDAHELADRFAGELGIEVLKMCGPYHCARCGSIVTEATCDHHQSEPDAVTHISGTDMRAMLTGGKTPDSNLMRPEILDSLAGLPLFIENGIS